MSDLVAAPEGVRGYGAVAATMAARTLAAGTVDQAAAVAAAIPVFGLIGQDFLASFAVAQANHLSSVGELAAVHAGTAAAAYESATEYEVSESDTAAAIHAIGNTR
ncbi:type VII secretion target [Nocardia sp. BMG111209]|uniref:type VII secretion target n=1 Tax=Nocardia sp. BMG111209 TaxID=1160137 RepID=UPI000475BAD4|nr:hypothetical protein [Nocardia sp. BMG111209]